MSNKNTPISTVANMAIKRPVSAKSIASRICDALDDAVAAGFEITIRNERNSERTYHFIVEVESDVGDESGAHGERVIHSTEARHAISATHVPIHTKLAHYANFALSTIQRAAPAPVTPSFPVVGDPRSFTWTRSADAADSASTA